jgi:hypothetical protein
VAGSQERRCRKLSERRLDCGFAKPLNHGRNCKGYLFICNENVVDGYRRFGTNTAQPTPFRWFPIDTPASRFRGSPL